PVAGGYATLGDHATVERRPRVRRQDMEGRCLNRMLDGPFHRSRKDRLVVAVHAEDKTAVDHDAQIVETTNRSGVVAAQILKLPLLGQVCWTERLEADEKTAEAGLDGSLEKVGGQHCVHGAGGLPQAAHAAHPVEESGRESTITKEVIVEKVQMSARQAVDFGKRRVHSLRIEASPSLEKRVLVAEVTDVRASPRDHDGVGDQIQVSFDEITPNRRQTV